MNDSKPGKLSVQASNPFLAQILDIVGGFACRRVVCGVICLACRQPLALKVARDLPFNARAVCASCGNHIVFLDTIIVMRRSEEEHDAILKGKIAKARKTALDNNYLTPSNGANIRQEVATSVEIDSVT